MAEKPNNIKRQITEAYWTSPKRIPYSIQKHGDAFYYAWLVAMGMYETLNILKIKMVNR